MRVLVGYASAHGSTREIAEHIAAQLNDVAGVSCLPFEEVPDPAAYDFFVLGSAIHSGAWLPEARTFLQAHAAALAAHPLWMFSVCSVGERSSSFGPRVSRRIRRLRRQPKGPAELAAVLRPRGHHWFAGVTRPQDWGLVGRAFMWAMRGRFGDHRDWAEVHAWAVQVAAGLHDCVGAAGDGTRRDDR